MDLTPYKNLLQNVKLQIQTARTKAALAVNRELIVLYWNIGQHILKKQAEEDWGGKIIDQLSADLKKAFPDMKGISSRNLKYMRQFASIYDNIEFVQVPLAQITWYHNIALMSKLRSNKKRIWYAQKTIENGWSRNVLVHQIALQLYERQGKAIHNFNTTLPHPQSDLVRETLKDPYIFDFLTGEEKMRELQLEKALTQHISQFLLELGAGFAFIGRQYHLLVGDKDYYIDLLFYHTKLHCYVAIDLKTGELVPEFVGKMNFYLSALDDNLKTERDSPSIGLILCKSKNKIVAEYALRGMTQPIGISDYKFPAELERQLPSIAEIEEELSKEVEKE